MSLRWQHRGIRRVIKQQQRRQKGNRWNGSNNGNRETAVNQSVWGGWVVGRRCKPLFCEAKQLLHSLLSDVLGKRCLKIIITDKRCRILSGQPSYPRMGGGTKISHHVPTRFENNKYQRGG